MGNRYLWAAGLACLGLLAGCRRLGDVPDGGPAAGKPAGKTPSAGSQTGGAGTLVVSGKGIGLYHVFDEAGEKKMGFTSTGNPLELPAGTYAVSLNNVRKKVSVKPGEQTSLQCGSVLLAGIAQDLYEVYDQTGKEKLNFKRTNGATELFEGSYVLRLNNSSTTVAVRAGERAVVEAGRVTVAGDGKDLYEVYDQTGRNKLSFTFTGKVTELLPGTYTVVCRAKKHPVVVKPKEQTTIKIE